MRVIFTAILTMMCGAINSQAAENRRLDLAQCGGTVIVEGDEEQTIVRIEDVSQCPYVIFNGERQSMQLTEGGRYSHFYVWHEDEDQQRRLSIVVHSATGEARDELNLKRASDNLRSVSSR